MMKRALIMLLVVVMLLSVVACGGSGSGDGGGTSAGGEADGDDLKGEGALTYAEYIAEEEGARVTIEAYVQATQSWRSVDGQGKIIVYLQDRVGAYLAYDMICEESDAAKLTKGTKIRVTGDKAVRNGDIEIVNGTFEFLSGSYVAQAIDVTSLLGTEELFSHQNKFVSFTGMTVEAIGEEDLTYYYRWDNSGSEGDDLYFRVSDGKNSYTFIVESSLAGADTDVYKAVKSLRVGDRINMEGFLYWYEGVFPHITSVTVVSSIS